MWINKRNKKNSLRKSSTMNLIRLRSQHLGWCRRSSRSSCLIIIQRKAAPHHKDRLFIRNWRSGTFYRRWCGRCVGLIMFRYLKVIHHSRYSSNSRPTSTPMVNFTSFTVGFRCRTVASKESLLPTSCALCYGLFISLGKKKKKSFRKHTDKTKYRLQLSKSSM